MMILSKICISATYKGRTDFYIPLSKPKSRKSGDKIRVHRNYIHKNQIQFKAHTGLFKHHCATALTLTEFR